MQGEPAPAQLVRAIEHFNGQAKPPDVLVLTRGGGSAEDLAAFSNEAVTRAVAASRIPTLVAIGHEVDLSLAELAADQRASTPSNAAELLTPDKSRELQQFGQYLKTFQTSLRLMIRGNREDLRTIAAKFSELLHNKIAQAEQELASSRQLLTELAPETILRRGYSIVRSGGRVIRSGKQLKTGQKLAVHLSDADISAEVRDIKLQ